MDSLIEKKSILTKINENKFKYLVVLLLAIIGYQVIKSIFIKSISADHLRIAEIQKGDFYDNVEGTGIAISSNVTSFYSPINSFIVSVKKKEGQFVEKGDTILQIDTSEMQKIISQNLNTNSILEANLRTMEIRFKSQQLNHKKNEEIYESNKKLHQYELESAEKLQKIGGISTSELMAIKEILQKDIIDLKYLKQSQELDRQALSEEINTIKLNIEINNNELLYNQKLLKQTTVVAKRDGILATQPYIGGEQVQTGSLLAQMNDDSKFYIQAQFSQREISKLQVGQSAEILINGQIIPGVLSILNSEIKNGSGEGVIEIKGELKTRLKQNQRVKVYVQNEKIENTLLVERGAFINSGGNIAFKIVGNEAIRVAIKIGSISNTHVQILSGLNAGDVIIVSSIEEIKQWDRFNLD